MKTSDLQGAALDWAVAKCETLEPETDVSGDSRSAFVISFERRWFLREWHPSTDWAQGGPIIERECISTECHFDRDSWTAWTPAPEQASGEATAEGHTSLIAAMRCYCCSKLGDEVEIPGGLK